MGKCHQVSLWPYVQLQTYKDRIQFHPGGAPVPLSFSVCQSAHTKKPDVFSFNVHVEVKTNFAERNPYVLWTAMGSQIRQRKKSSMMMKSEKRNTALYHFGGR